MSVLRGFGHMLGGTLQGYGQGVVEQAKMNWAKMLQDESDAKADARQEKAFAHAESMEGERQFAQLGDTAIKVKASEKEGDLDRDLKREELKIRGDETAESRKGREQYQQVTLEERRLTRKDNYNLRLREIEGREAEITTGDLKQIESAETSLIGQYATDEQRKAAAPKVVAALKETNPKLARYYATLQGIPFDGEPSPDPKADPGAPPPASAAPGLGGGQSKQEPKPKPPKPAEYPEAKWSDREGAWVVQKGGEWYAVD